MDELKDKRLEKQGVVTVETLLKDALKHVEDIENITLVVKYKDGVYDTAWSKMSKTEAIGTLEIGKMDIFEEGKLYE